MKFSFSLSSWGNTGNTDPTGHGGNLVNIGDLGSTTSNCLGFPEELNHQIRHLWNKSQGFSSSWNFLVKNVWLSEMILCSTVKKNHLSRKVTAIHRCTTGGGGQHVGNDQTAIILSRTNAKPGHSVWLHYIHILFQIATLCYLSSFWMLWRRKVPISFQFYLHHRELT